MQTRIHARLQSRRLILWVLCTLLVAGTACGTMPRARTGDASRLQTNPGKLATTPQNEPLPVQNR